MAIELAGLGVRVRRTLRGGAEFSATERQLYAANLWLRTANRVVVRAGLAFTARTFEELEAHLEGLPSDRWIPAGCRPQVRVSSVSSQLFHTGAVAERVAQVLSRGTDPGPLVVVRIMHDRVLVSVDSSGAPLFQRGWRLETAKAPLRETLAAAMLQASAWDRRAPLVDPFCGSGTIPIEAALLAAGVPPGHRRRFAFQDWPSFQPGTWASVTGEALARPVVDAPLIVGADRDAGAVRTAAANADRAGVTLDLRRGALSALSISAARPGWLVSNPPYGKRVESGRELYSRLGDIVRRRFTGWKIGLLVSDPGLAAQSRLPWRDELRTTNGGIPVTFLLSG